MPSASSSSRPKTKLSCVFEAAPRASANLRYNCENVDGWAMGELLDIGSGFEFGTGLTSALVGLVGLILMATMNNPGNNNDDDDSSPGGGLMQPVA